MSQVTVSGQFDMPPLSPDTHAIIALSDREYGEALNPYVGQHLHLAFHDMCWDDHLQGFDSANEVLQYPDPKHLEQLRDYLAEHQPKHLHVACHAGVSRSTALALVAYRLLNEWATDEDALRNLFRVRPHCYPNRRIVRQADALFGYGLEAALYQHYLTEEPNLASDWQGPNSSIRGIF